MEKQKRQKGGAEKLRAKKLKSLTEDASKCVQITDMFTAAASASSVDEDRSRQGEQQTDMQACDSATEGQTEQTESHQRMNIWEKESHSKRHRPIAPIGETRWWAKHIALKKMFGSFGKPQDCLYVDVLCTLSAIQEQKTVKGNVRTKARGYKDGLLRHETILTAQLFMRIFKQTTPLSKYLQTGGMDILSAHRMVISTHEALKQMARDFKAVKDAADNFVKWANEKLEEQDEEIDMEVEASLPQRRPKKKKSMPGEMFQDETSSDALETYELTDLGDLTVTTGSTLPATSSTRPSPTQTRVVGGLWNCQSAVQKADFISALASHHLLHFLALTETWITPENSTTPAALSSAFNFSHSPRQTGRGGGTGPHRDLAISFGNSLITAAEDARSLGVILDGQLSFSAHIANLTWSCRFLLYNIRKIRPFVSQEATQLPIQSLVILRLDYCNSLLAGLPLRAIRPLQLVQNAAARIIFNLPKFTHLTPLLLSLHWLPVVARIRFKTLMLTYKAKNGPAPPYLMAMVKSRAVPRALQASSMSTGLGFASQDGKRITNSTIVAQKEPAMQQYQNGVTQRKIAKTFKLSSSTVHNIIKRFRESGTIAVRKGQGRKTLLDARDLRALKRHCTSNRNAAVKEITEWAQEYFQKALSVNTIHRAIRRCQLKVYSAKRKPFLSKLHKLRRLHWARGLLKWSVAKWKTVLWSDVLYGTLGRHVIRTREDKDNPSCYQRSVQKPASLMGLAVLGIAMPKPGDDAAAQDALHSASVEHETGCWFCTSPLAAAPPLCMLSRCDEAHN
ncbi:hypothetical protein NFI96_000286 [Prochilodus magdalenae]|nr:hypothetical protein NFI96_000286 [Prochilodus magdalenae]